MRPRTTWLLALLVMALGIWLYLAPSEAPETADSARLSTFDPAAVSTIRIERGNEIVEIARRNEAWSILAPQRTRADDQRVDALLHTAANTTKVREIYLEEHSLADYGLAAPRVTLQINSHDGMLTRIEIGKDTPVGNNSYVRIGSDDTLAIVSADLRFAADRGLDDLRDRLLLPERAHPRSIRFRRPNVPDVSLERDDDTWRIVEPFNVRADGRRVGEWLQRVRELRAESFLDEATQADLEAYSLQNPALVIDLDFDGKARTERLEFGGPNLRAAERQRWVRTAGSSSLASVGAEAVNAIDVPPDTLRDRKFLTADRGHIASLELRRENGDNFVLTRENRDWTMPGHVTNPENTSRFVADAVELHGDELVSSAGGEAQFGLDSPSLSLSFRDPEGVSIGKILVAESPGTQTRHYATLAGSGVVYSLSSEAFARVDQTPESLSSVP